MAALIPFVLKQITSGGASRPKNSKLEEQLQRSNEELRQIKEQLEKKVRERTARLQESVEELEAFSYSLSHDMRAPLRAISGYTQIILAEHCHQLQGETAALVEKISRAGGRMDQLITDVLALTKITHAELRTEAIDVEKMLQQIIEERPELQPPRAEVIIQTPLTQVWGDPASLSQCLTNLLSNAVKYVNSGVTPQIRIWTQRDADKVRLWVADNGIGIECSAQKQIFEMFHRLNKSPAYDGTGIGLAIVRKAVERMGGRAGVESEPGKGSQFWLDLKEATPLWLSG